MFKEDVTPAEAQKQGCHPHPHMKYEAKAEPVQQKKQI